MLPRLWWLRLTGTSGSPRLHRVRKTLQTSASLNPLAALRPPPQNTRRDHPPKLQGRGALAVSWDCTTALWPWTILLLATVLTGSFWPGASRAQEHKTKVPGLDKITGGPSQQAFSGIVESLDKQRKVLNVNTVTGGAIEIFPIKKNVHVATADGDKLTLAEVKPGANVLIYYEQKGDHRTVKEIIVLKGEPNPGKKSPPPS